MRHALALLVLTSCTSPPANSPTNQTSGASPTEPAREGEQAAARTRASAPVVLPERSPGEIAAYASERTWLPRLYSCAFEQPYRFMFNDNDPQTGAFLAGVHGIVYYGRLASCMGQMAGVRGGNLVGDPSPIEAFAPVRLVAERRAGFRHYEVEAIRWGHENLIPPPDMVIRGHTAYARYHSQYRRFFRVMAESYLELQPSIAYRAEQERYQLALEGDTRALPYLESRFSGRLDHHALPRDGMAMTVPMAYGFWLRRGIDGTDEELWIGLRKVLLLYDHDWYSELPAMYPDAGVAW